jgi:16S rRNA (uracil1498-N3)-methyltransferase
MARFFIEGTPTETAVISGEDGRHISRSLRMRVGETLTLCNSQGLDFDCEITAIDGDNVTVAVTGQRESIGEPTVQVTVYQGLPKSDKMDWIVQKAVESGAARLVPMMTERCVSRPDEKAAAKKRERWQKIAEEAAKQCGRGRIPEVAPLTTFRKAMEAAAAEGQVVFFYEGGGTSLRKLVNDNTKQVSIFIGPEGGFAEEEVALAQEHGAAVGSLGTRIFRTETAATAALAAIMALTGNL